MAIAADQIDEFRYPLCEKHNFRGEICLSCIFEKIPKWIPASIDAPFDGEYLCVVEIKQECGEVWTRQRVRNNSRNKWILEENEIITHYQKLQPNP